jgi:hypothetical protein
MIFTLTMEWLRRAIQKSGEFIFQEIFESCVNFHLKWPRPSTTRVLAHPRGDKRGTLVQMQLLLFCSIPGEE